MCILNTIFTITRGERYAIIKKPSYTTCLLCFVVEIFENSTTIHAEVFLSL